MGEIESYLLKHSKVKEAVVLERDDGDGNKYLCAYIALTGKSAPGQISSASTELRNHLSQSLPDYMMPSYFMYIEKFPLTPNGKIDRKALQKPEPEVGQGYIPPRDAVEKRLAVLWSEVLGIEKNLIGIDSNFFQLGGHSLKAVIMSSKAHKALDVKIPLAEVFKTPTIRGLSQYIKKAEKDKYLAIEPVEKKEYYTLSSAQKRLYILQQMELKSTAYNMPQIIPLPEDPDIKRLEETFIQLIDRHESFRTSFHVVNDEPVQKVHDEVEFKIKYYEATENTGEGRKIGKEEPFGQINAFGEGDNHEGHEGHEDKESPKYEIRNTKQKQKQPPLPTAYCLLTTDFIRPFDLCKAPLLKVGIVKTLEGGYVLVVVMHHIISDGVSHEILVKDFMALYKGKELPPLRVQYKDFSKWQNKQKQKEYIKQQQRYWLRQFEGKIPELDLATDYPRPKAQLFAGTSLSDEISCDINTLRAIALENNATPFMVLLTIFNIFLSKVSGQEDIVLGTPVAGRRHADLEGIMGLFVNSLALRNRPKGEKTFIEFLQEVKEITLEAFENQDYQFEDLVEKLAVKRDRHNPIFDVMFTCQDQGTDGPDGTEVTNGRTKDNPQKDIPDAREEQSSNENKPGTSKFDLYLSIVVGKKLGFSFEYSTELFRRQTIEAFARVFKEIVLYVLEDKNIKLEDIRMSTTILDSDLSDVQEELSALEF
jgi:acyl carrier protein